MKNSRINSHFSNLNTSRSTTNFTSPIASNKSIKTNRVTLKHSDDTNRTYQNLIKDCSCLQKKLSVTRNHVQQQGEINSKYIKRLISKASPKKDISFKLDQTFKEGKIRINSKKKLIEKQKSEIRLKPFL